MKRPDALPSRIVLIVDDDPGSLAMVSQAMEEAGMMVMVARDGQAAIELARRISPDVILLDAVMPGMDGFETCRRLKAPPLSIDAPVVFMTGLSDAEHILAGLGAGGVDYVTKPLNLEELVARVTVHLVNARLIRSARDALDSSGHSVLAFREDGSLSWGSPQALQMLEGVADLTDPQSTLRREALAWLENLPATPVSHSEPFLMIRERLALHYIGATQAGEWLVRLENRLEERPEERLERVFGLTAREAEVLLWLTRGKTNRDIGDILSLSARTVNKHLEQVFHKMGVDNRTSAAVLADRAILQDH
ncbi:MAG: DNA-binding response regulator [Neomegalonema sp.]|nr:DNA-binding response regulator [Neomegalonema sp.]